MAKQQNTKWNGANRFEVAASFKSVTNTTLARALYPILTWTSYDRHQAHMWALRMIKANPQTGADVAEALVNFDWMIESARACYERNAYDRKKWDAALVAFQKWKAEQEMAVAKAA